MKTTNRIDFAATNRAALTEATSLLGILLPGGRRIGAEYVALNPTRPDGNPGSFCINIRTGRWADFATGDRGGDLISLAAYVNGTHQLDAARFLARLLGIDEKGGDNG